METEENVLRNEVALQRCSCLIYRLGIGEVVSGEPCVTSLMYACRQQQDRLVSVEVEQVAQEAFALFVRIALAVTIILVVPMAK